MFQCDKQAIKGELITTVLGMQKRENMTYDHRKNRSIETDLKMTEIKEQAHKENKTDIINMLT